jgi:threonine/homoserine/homoserine lactone efflux protein
MGKFYILTRRLGSVTLALVLVAGRWLKKCLKWIGKLAWRGLMYLDYLGGLAWLAWDKRRSHKAKKR